MYKKILSSILVGALCITTLSGCSKKEENPIMTSDHKILEYDLKNLPENRYYIKKKNNKFQPLLQEGVKGEYAWFTKYDNLIPVLEKGDKLIYTSVKSKPYSFQMAKMKNLGYTVGIRFNVKYLEEEATDIYSFPTTSDGYCPFSKVGKIVGEKVSDKSTSIKEINGKKITSLMFTDEGFLKGLTKDAMYQFGYYYGTKYEQIDVKADTHIFTRQDSLLSNTFKETKKGYIEIGLPEGGSEAGYYNLEENNGGMFRVE